jgi:hypothetical protein
LLVITRLRRRARRPWYRRPTDTAATIDAPEQVDSIVAEVGLWHERMNEICRVCHGRFGYNVTTRGRVGRNHQPETMA